jgi:glucosylceramidase
MVRASLFLVAPAAAASARLVQTAPNGDRIADKGTVQFGSPAPFSGPVVDVSATDLDQTIVGFGGAFTDSASQVYSRLSADLQKQMLDMYFGPDGIGYTLGRVHINSCDFSTYSYSFDDTAGDADLSHFDSSVAHDAKQMIPLMRAAQALLGQRNTSLDLLASPWSPAAWMKTNGMMDHSNQPCLLDQYKQTWADYISKWIDAYKAQGLPIKYLTPQNEPENNATWEACTYLPQEERDWVDQHLGPALAKAHPEVAILGFDHNRDHVQVWADALANSQYVSGIAFHWYSGDQFDNVAAVHAKYPKTLLLNSEATYEEYRWQNGTTFVDGDWTFGFGYAHDIMGVLNAGGSGWLDWNLILNTTGGPNHVDNVCDAPLVGDVEQQKLYVHPQYYFIGHFSKFLPPGSMRLKPSGGSLVSNSTTYSGPVRAYGTCTADDGLQATAFQRPDQSIVTVVLNCGDSAIDFQLRDSHVGALAASIPGRSIQTFIHQRGQQERTILV